MKILAIGAHPDDIEFGCGGTLIKYSMRADDIFLLVLTKGGVGGEPETRKEEQERAGRFLNIKQIFWGNFSDTQIPTGRELILAIENVMNQIKPDIIFFNYFNDIHQDHRAIANGSITATRYVENVLFYEVPTTQGFEPDIFVDITDVLDQKLKLLEAHSSQVDKTRIPHLTILESAKSCANFRGFQGRVKYAEGFKSLRFLMEI